MEMMNGAQAMATRPSFQAKAIPMAKPATRVTRLCTILCKMNQRLIKMTGINATYAPRVTPARPSIF